MSFNNEKIDINHLLQIIEHNLVKSDIFPHDRQNYSSCMKVTSDDVLTLLKQQNNKAIYTYVKGDTNILSRLYYGWVVAFSYRIWWSSIHINQNLSQLEKDNCFLTKAAWLSSEINIHCLTLIIISVSQGYLPPYALNSYLFSSQPCEATYSLKFPVHHKNRHNETASSNNIQDISSVTQDDVEKIIIKAYYRAESIMNNLKLTEVLKNNKLDDLNKLNERSTVDYSVINSYDSLDDEDDDNPVSDEPDGIDSNDNSDDSEEDNQEEHHLTTSK